MFNETKNNNIIFVCNPATFIKPEGSKFDVRQVDLYCYNCSTRVNMTEENAKTLPEALFTAPLEQLTFDHSPLYSGICLRPECGPDKKYSKF